MAFIVNTNRSSMDNCSSLCSADAPEIEVDKSWVHGEFREETVIKGGKFKTSIFFSPNFSAHTTSKLENL